MLDSLGAALTEAVVFRGVPLVTVAFDSDASGGMIPEEIRGLVKSVARIGTKRSGVVIKVGITNVLLEKLV